MLVPLGLVVCGRHPRRKTRVWIETSVPRSLPAETTVTRVARRGCGLKPSQVVALDDATASPASQDAGVD